MVSHRDEKSEPKSAKDITINGKKEKQLGNGLYYQDDLKIEYKKSEKWNIFNDDTCDSGLN